MQYITGVHALNLPCSLNTCGDWHTSALKWEELDIRESEESIFKEWGIEPPIELPNGETIRHADHLRAILDILSTGDKGKIAWLKWFRDDFLCTEEYTQVLLEKVSLLKDCKGWEYIEDLMLREFTKEWEQWRETI